MNTELTLDPQFNPQSEAKIQKSPKEPWNKGKLMGQKPPLKLKVRDVAHGEQASKRAMVMQQKTHQPVQFEITEQTRTAVTDWIKQAKLKSEDFLFPSRIHSSAHIATRQYARLVEKWVASIGLNPNDYGTHS